MALLGPLIGAKKLGCRLKVVPPGKTARPFHAHLANEVMIVVLEGGDTLRLADAVGYCDGEDAKADHA